MPHDEAARTPDPTAPGGGTPPNQPERPADERPRPQFGEYAPPGWTWQPPEAAPPTEPATPPPAAAAWGEPAASNAGTGSAAHPIDRAWTITLLVFGAFGAIYNALSLFALPQNVVASAQLSASMLGVDAPTSFTPGPQVPVLIGVGIALQVALWAGALLWSRARMRAGRLAWWVPLVAGVAAFVVVVVIGLLVFASDPAFFTAITTPPR